MSSLGIYFGPALISMVETKGKKILNNIRIPQATLAPAELEEKVPDEVKIVALFKEELRRNKVEARQANITLSGKDLIIRTFEMPVLSREDLANAINFEARKYVPFKIEELILDYQLYFDKAIQKNLVLLAGIKKEVLDKQLSIFKQLNLQINSIEYSAFSALRLLKLAGIKDKGVMGVVDADLAELDEVNFTVLEDGFPLFSRDISLSGGPEAPAQPGEEQGMLLEKFKTEIRISLDYYNRKFPVKKIEKTFFILNADYQSDLGTFGKEIGLDIQFIDIAKYLDKPVPFSLSFIKAYTCSLTDTIKTTLKIDLLLAKAKAVREKEAAMPAGAVVSLLKGLRIDPRIVILGLLICAGAFGFGLYRKLPLEKELKSIISMRPRVSTVSPDSDYEQLSSIDSEYKQRIATLDNLVKKQLYLTEPLDTIPRIIPDGIWLKDFSFNKQGEGVELVLNGMAYLADSDKEFTLVNSFLGKLKEDPVFARYFKEINMVSLNRAQSEGMAVTDFQISCRANK